MQHIKPFIKYSCKSIVHSLIKFAKDVHTYFQVSDFVKKKASFKIQEVILRLYSPTKAAFQTCNHSWSIKAPSSRQYSTSVSLNRLLNPTIAWNKVKFTCNKYTIHLHWESNLHSIYKTLIKRVALIR